MSVIAIDLSHWSTVHDAAKVKASGVKAVLMKATEGSGLRDDKYVAFRKMFTDLGLKWGAYHFFHGDSSEADFFLSVADLGKDDVAVLDWEDLSGGGSPSAGQARGWLERVNAKLGRKAIIYSGNVAKERIQGHDPFFAGHRLWLAQYSRVWSVQQSWTKPWLWQYSEQGQVPGVAGFCDVNTIVSGTPEEFILNWTGEPQPTPQPKPPIPPSPAPIPVPSPTPVFETGEASWYEDNENADGSHVNNAVDMTCAHKSLRFGTWVKVTRTDNGLHCVVRVTDRGPFVEGRIIDLRPRPADALQMKEVGVVPVKLEIVHNIGDFDGI